VISATQRPLPDNTQHSQETGIHDPGGIPIRIPRKRAAADSRLLDRTTTGISKDKHRPELYLMVQFYRAVNTLRFSYENKSLSESLLVLRPIQNINTLCGRNVKFMILTPCGRLHKVTTRL
jgi:hypothetical protein